MTNPEEINQLVRRITNYYAREDSPIGYASFDFGNNNEYVAYLKIAKIGEEIPKEPEKECTLEPYCKCEDCQNYQGELPIDRE